jgi:hypothetical protein
MRPARPLRIPRHISVRQNYKGLSFTTENTEIREIILFFRDHRVLCGDKVLPLCWATIISPCGLSSFAHTRKTRGLASEQGTQKASISDHDSERAPADGTGRAENGDALPYLPSPEK